MNLDKAGKMNFLGLSYGLTSDGGHLENKICSFLHVKNTEKIVNTRKMQRISHTVECDHPELSLLENNFAAILSFFFLK